MLRRQRGSTSEKNKRIWLEIALGAPASRRNTAKIKTGNTAQPMTRSKYDPVSSVRARYKDTKSAALHKNVGRPEWHCEGKYAPCADSENYRVLWGTFSERGPRSCH